MTSAEEISESDLPGRPAPRPVSAGGGLDDVRDAIRRRSTSLQARVRLSEAIHALALDIVGSERLSSEEQAFLRQRIVGPVAEAADEALAVLTHELAEALRLAPSRIRPSIYAAPLVSRTDFE